MNNVPISVFWFSLLPREKVLEHWDSYWGFKISGGKIHPLWQRDGMLQQFVVTIGMKEDMLLKMSQVESLSGFQGWLPPGYGMCRIR